MPSQSSPTKMPSLPGLVMVLPLMKLPVETIDAGPPTADILSTTIAIRPVPEI